MAHDHLNIPNGFGDLRLFFVSDMNVANLIIILILGSNIRACMN